MCKQLRHVGKVKAKQATSGEFRVASCNVTTEILAQK